MSEAGRRLTEAEKEYGRDLIEFGMIRFFDKDGRLKTSPAPIKNVMSEERARELGYMTDKDETGAKFSVGDQVKVAENHVSRYMGKVGTVRQSHPDGIYSLEIDGAVAEWFAEDALSLAGSVPHETGAKKVREFRERLHPELRKLVRDRLRTLISDSSEWSGTMWRAEVQKLADELAPGYGQTGAEIVRKMLHSLWSQADYTAAEVRNSISEVAEEVPALKLVLADADDDWTRADWQAAVDQVAKTLGGEDKDAD